MPTREDAQYTDVLVTAKLTDRTLLPQMLQERIHGTNTFKKRKFVFAFKFQKLLKYQKKFSF